MTADIVTRIIMWVAIAMNLFSAWMSLKSRKDLQARLATLQDANIRHEISTQIYNDLAIIIGFDVDLIDRTITDMAFLHGQVYAQDSAHHCPTCDSTVPELEQIRSRLQSVRVDFQGDRR